MNSYTASKFTKGHEKRVLRAEKLYGQHYGERLHVFIDGEALDPKKKQGSILVIAEVMGLLEREGLSVMGFKIISREGKEMEIYSADLSLKDFDRFEKLFAEHALDEKCNPGNHPVIGRLKEMCEHGQSLVVAIKKE